MTRLPALAAALAIAAVPVAAHAAVLMVTTPTGLPPAEAKQLEKAIKESLRSAGHTVVKSTVSLDDSAAALGCSPAVDACVARIAATAGAAVLAAPAAERDGARMTVKFSVYRGSDGKWLGAADVTVDTAGEVADYAHALSPAIERVAITPTASDGAAGSGAGVGAGAGSGGADAEGGTSRSSAFKKIPVATWGVAGAGLVMLGLGIYYAVRTGALQNDYDATPLTTDAERRDARILATKGKHASAAAAALLTAGSIAAAGAAFIIVDSLWLGLVVHHAGDATTVGVSVAGRF
jgi:hypothetical protein